MELLWGEGGYVGRAFVPSEPSSDDPLPSTVSLTGVPEWIYLKWEAPLDPTSCGGSLDFDLVRSHLYGTVGPVMLDPWNSKSTEVRHSKPRNVPYDGLVDHKRYGGYLSSLSLLLSTLRMEKFPAKAIENEVIHSVASGRCTCDTSTIYNTSIASVPFVDSEVLEYGFDGEPTYTDSSGQPDWQTSAGSGNFRDLVGSVQASCDYLNDNLGIVLHTVSTGCGSLETKYTSATCTVADDEKSIIYDYTGETTLNWSYGGYQTYRGFHVTYHFEFGIDQIPGIGVTQLAGSFGSQRALVGGLVTRTCAITYLGTTYPGTLSEPHWGSDKTYSLSWQLGLKVVSHLGNNLKDDAVSTYMSIVAEMDRIIEFRHPSLFSAAVRSSSEAVDEFRTFMRSNYLESISEIKEVLRLLPNPEPITRFLELVPAGKFIAAGFRLVDFAAQTYLLMKFGLDPFYNDIYEFATKFDRIARVLRQRLGSGHDARGKFTYTFPEGDELDGYQLVTRSKVRIRIPPGSPAASLLPLSMAGLEPSSSQLWDLIPFSFAIDWFTNLGDRLETGDNAAFLLTAAVDYSVHSYTLYKTLGTDDFGSSGLVPQGLCQYKHYWRTVSRYNPNVLRNYKYDWWGDGSVPADLAGSLVWVLARPN